jgi:hypothetical protein
MADLAELPRPSQLWKQMSPEQKQQAAEAFWSDDNAGMEQAEAIGYIAQRIKFRPKSVYALPVEKKARHLLAMPGVSEIIAARLLVVYHLAQQRPMMGSFLDALGIAHEEGLIADEDMPPPSEEKLRHAATAIAATYPADDVALYLTTLVWQDFDTWGALADAPERKSAEQGSGTGDQASGTTSGIKGAEAASPASPDPQSPITEAASTPDAQSPIPDPQPPIPDPQ